MTDRKAGRLAIRDEGKWVVAYYAEPGTMEGAIELARILKPWLDQDVDGVLFDEWKITLGAALVRLIGSVTGVEVLLRDEEPAPPHERVQ